MFFFFFFFLGFGKFFGEERAIFGFKSNLEAIEITTFKIFMKGATIFVLKQNKKQKKEKKKTEKKKKKKT